MGYDEFDPLLHCDEPSRTCAVQGTNGAWCAAPFDCDGQKGFDCLDETAHRPSAPFAVGSCVMRSPPGATCDQAYQCTSFACTSGKCAPLLGTGQECIFDTECASGSCKTICS